MEDTVFKKIINKARYLYRKYYRNRYMKKCRQRIVNKDFSIISHLCVGGIIYDNLGLPYLSPTVGLSIERKEFVKFATNLKHYLAQDLVFIPSEDQFPVALLDDITIRFKHYETEQEAKEKWERRKERINYDNLFFIAADWVKFSEEELEKVRQAGYKGIAILSHTPNNLAETIIIPYHDSMEIWPFDKDKKGFRQFEKYWDYVSWLNGNQ